MATSTFKKIITSTENDAEIYTYNFGSKEGVTTLTVLKQRSQGQILSWVIKIMMSSDRLTVHLCVNQRPLHPLSGLGYGGQ